MNRIPLLYTEGADFMDEELVKDIAQRQKWSQEATHREILKIVTADRSPLRWFCRNCQKVTNWIYFGYASFVGATYRCEECDASTYDGMADYDRSE